MRLIKTNAFRAKVAVRALRLDWRNVTAGTKHLGKRRLQLGSVGGRERWLWIGLFGVVTCKNRPRFDTPTAPNHDLFVPFCLANEMPRSRQALQISRPFDVVICSALSYVDLKAFKATGQRGCIFLGRRARSRS